MMLGLSILGLGSAPQPFTPWQSARCVGWWDASGAQTNVAGRCTAAPSLSAPGDATAILTPNTTGPVITAASIFGQTAWVFDGTADCLKASSFANPQPPPSTVFFYYAVARVRLAGSGFACLLSGGGTAPETYIPSSTTLGATAGSPLTVAMALNTPKRLVQRHGPQTSTDFIQWGAAITTGNLGSTVNATGIYLAARGDLNAVCFGGVDIACAGIFLGDPSTGGLQASLDAYIAARFTAAGGLFT